MTVIKVPNRDFSGKIGNVQFTDGQADTDDPAVIGYAQAAGYEVGGKVLNEVPGREIPGPRDVSTERVGTPLRDGAVDPEGRDFLAPIGAGEGNPHGPEVFAPGIHAERPGPVVPGPVSGDPDTQEEKEKAAAAEAVSGERNDSPEVPAEAPEVPAGNAGRDDWVAYALATGADPGDLEGKGRDQIRSEYGPRK